MSKIEDGVVLRRADGKVPKRARIILNRILKQILNK